MAAQEGEWQESIWKHNLSLDTGKGTAGDVAVMQGRSEAPRVGLGAQFELGYRGRDVCSARTMCANAALCPQGRKRFNLSQF